MDENSLSHTRWTCTYHIVFIPKYRRIDKESVKEFEDPFKGR